MDLSQLSAQDMLQLHTLMARIQQSTSGQGPGGAVRDSHVIPAVATPHNPAGNPPANINHLQQTFQNTNPVIHSTSPLFTGSIQPYQTLITTQSLPPAPQGHPSPAAALAVASPSMQPFLGRDTLAVNMAGQVNRERRASRLLFLGGKQFQSAGPDVAVVLQLLPHLYPVDQTSTTVSLASLMEMGGTPNLCVSKSRCTRHK